MGRVGATLVSVVLVAVCCVTALPGHSARAGVNYCRVVVPSRTDCAQSPGQPGDWYDGVFARNDASYPGTGGTINVCEHTYTTSSPVQTIDRICGNSFFDAPISSTTSVCPYYNGRIRISAHVGNDSAPYAHTIDGFADTLNSFGRC